MGNPTNRTCRGITYRVASLSVIAFVMLALSSGLAAQSGSQGTNWGGGYPGGAVPGFSLEVARFVPGQGAKLEVTGAPSLKPYYVLCSLSGTRPGVPVPGAPVGISLNYDAFFLLSLWGLIPDILKNSIGITDANGRASATFQIPALQELIGFEVYFQTVVLDPLAAGSLGALSDARSAVIHDGTARIVEPTAQIPALNALVLRAYGGTESKGIAAQAGRRLRRNLNQINGGTGVLPHSGQAFLEQTDLRLAGRDPAVALAGRDPAVALAGRDPAVILTVGRCHQSRVDVANSIFGPAWACNLQQTLQETTRGNMVLHAFGRQIEFTSAGEDLWHGTEGRFGVLSTGRLRKFFFLRTPGGTTFRFQAESNGKTIVGHLTRITSPNQNSVQIEYESSTQQPDLLKRRIVKVTESYGREITFHYENTALPHLVTRIQDFEGHEWRYDYTATGQLKSVRTPVVVSTGQVRNDFPNGKLTTFTYENHATLPSLQNALKSVTFPNQARTGGSGQPGLAWTYFDTGAHAGRVKTFTLGNPSAGAEAAGGTYHYAYASCPIYQKTPTVHDVVMVTTVTDRLGTLTEVHSNSLGHMLEEVIQSRENPGQTFERSFRYTPDGVLTRITTPLRAGTHFQVDETSMSRLSQGNVLSMETVPDGRGATQTSLLTTVVYEPVTNRPYKVVTPRGYETGNNPADFTTVCQCDYMEDLAGSVPVLAPTLGLTLPQLNALLTAAGIQDLGADVNGDGRTDLRTGNRIRVVHPTVTLPREAGSIVPSLTQDAVELWRYNAFGQLIYYRDAEENVTSIAYHGACDPDGDGTVDVPGASTVEGGYVREVVHDAESGAGRQSGQNPPPVKQTIRYEYKPYSGFPANRHGVPTAITDGRGITHRYLVNELDQVVMIVRAHSAPTPLQALAYETHILYDDNDNVMERRVQHKHTLGNDNDYIVTTYTHDILGQVVKMTRDAGTGHLNLVTAWSYDAGQNRTRVTRAQGTSEATSTTWTAWTRDLPRTRTRGAGTADASTVSYVVDDDGRCVKFIDAHGSDEIEYERDGYGRVVKTTDRMGLVTKTSYDSAGHVVAKAVYGSSGSSQPGTELLENTVYHHDNRERLFRVDRGLSFHAGKNVGTLDDGSLYHGDGYVNRLAFRDRKGRVVGTMDEHENLSQYLFNGRSWTLRTVDNAGNIVNLTYDGSGNLTSLRQTEVAPGLIQSPEVSTTTYVCDALNRRTSEIEPNQQTTTYHYDSLDNLISRIDAMGNTVEIRRDRLGRPVDRRTYLSSNGQNATANNKDPNQGGGDGMIKILQTWNALSRVTSRTDDRGQVTADEHDPLGRLVKRVFMKGTNHENHERWTYNADSELLTHTTRAGSVEAWKHDASGRPIEVNIATSLKGGTTRKTWDRNGLGQVIRTTDNNNPANSSDDVVTRTYVNSLGQPIKEFQQIGNRPELAVETEWQGLGRKASITYPNGRKVRRAYEKRNRLARIFEGSSTLARFDYVGVRDLRWQFENGTEMDRRNSAHTQTIGGTDPGYDLNGRVIRQAWMKTGGAEIVRFENTFNRADRRTASVITDFTTQQFDLALDSAYRMLEVDRGTLSTVQLSRTLDGADNMTAYVDQGTPQYPVPGEMNRYTKFAGQNRTYHDDGGVDLDDRYDYLYDYESRLMQVRDRATNNLIARFWYTADGKCVHQTDGTNANPVQYVYRGWQVVEERTGDGKTVLRQYVDGRSLDEHIQLKDYTQSGNPVYYYHANTRHFTRALTNAQGQPVEYYRYHALGKPTIIDAATKQTLSKSKVGNSYLFQGRRFVPETGHYYYRNRFYDPVTGRFLTLDPLGIYAHGQGNGYAAFGEDPWNVVQVESQRVNGASAFWGAYEWSGTVLVDPPPGSYLPGQAGQVFQPPPDDVQPFDEERYLGHQQNVENYINLSIGYGEQHIDVELEGILAQVDYFKKLPIVGIIPLVWGAFLKCAAKKDKERYRDKDGDGVNAVNDADDNDPNVQITPESEGGVLMLTSAYSLTFTAGVTNLPWLNGTWGLAGTSALSPAVGPTLHHAGGMPGVPWPGDGSGNWVTAGTASVTNLPWLNGTWGLAGAEALVPVFSLR